MKDRILFKTLVGSQAYGTSIPTSDEDYKGIYIQSKNDILSFNYKDQFEVSKDECYYEVRRFLQLAQTANPTILEMLYMEDKHIIETSPEFELIHSHRHKFLTKKCAASFGGYAIAQIKKAKGLDKKMNWEKERVERKTPFDFCYIYENGKTIPLKVFLERNFLIQEQCGLVALNHFKDCYGLYYDFDNSFGYKGISLDDSNTIRLSSIPKDVDAVRIMFYNKDGYSMHCKDYREYEHWLKHRNTQRYVDIQNHEQSIDGKNLLHCRRLLDMALEIVETKYLTVKRPNADYLIKIRRGEIPLEEIIENAENDIQRLNDLFKKSDLPENVDREFVNDLLLQVRNYDNNSEQQILDAYHKIANKIYPKPLPIIL